jgi:drug/metabolite transporter (DMT)-like permease
VTLGRPLSRPLSLLQPFIHNFMRLKADLLLLLVTLLWGSAFAIMRVAARHEIVFLLNGSRFLLGGLLLLPFARMKGAFTRKNWFFVVLAGCALFIAAFFQQSGLKTTTAGNGGFITILYAVDVPIILWIGWRERPALKTWLAVAAAGFGGFLLSTGGSYKIAPGDLLIFIGSFFWALHVVIIGKGQGKIAPLPFASGQYLVCGLLNLVVGAFTERPSQGDLLSILPAILYTAIFSIAIGFTLQVIAQKHTPSSDAALILSLEAVFAAAFGWLFLKEMLSPIQLSGCAFILAAVMIVQFGSGKILRRRKS